MFFILISSDEYWSHEANMPKVLLPWITVVFANILHASQPDIFVLDKQIIAIVHSLRDAVEVANP